MRSLADCFVFRCPLYGYFNTFQTSLIKLIDQAFNEVVHIRTYSNIWDARGCAKHPLKMAGNTPISRSIVPCWSSSWKQSMAGGADHLCTASLIGSYISIGYELAKSLDMWLTGRHWEERCKCTCLQWERKSYCRI